MDDERTTRDGIRYRVRPMDAEGLAEIERLRAEHPTEWCALFRTPTGRCTCPKLEPHHPSCAIEHGFNACTCAAFADSPADGQSGQTER